MNNDPIIPRDNLPKGGGGLQEGQEVGFLQLIFSFYSFINLGYFVFLSPKLILLCSPPPPYHVFVASSFRIPAYHKLPGNR